MEIKSENIKEIILDTLYVFYAENENYYSDVLKITKNSINYKRKSYVTGKTISSWQYKTNNELFNINYENLLEALDKELKKEKMITYTTDVACYTITIKFVDGSEILIDRTDNFFSNGMMKLANAFLQMIPQGELYPDLLEYYFSIETLDKDTLNEITKESLIALMYAEDGAMGNPGHIEVIDENCIRYIAETLFGAEVTQKEVTSLFDGIDEFQELSISDISNIYLNDSCWKYINLGCGNHLFLRDDFYNDISNLICLPKASMRYKAWNDYIESKSF